MLVYYIFSSLTHYSCSSIIIIEKKNEPKEEVIIVNQNIQSASFIFNWPGGGMHVVAAKWSISWRR